jgi:hypothetical protein
MGHTSTTETKTYGTRPVGSCKPDGRTQWATRTRIDRGWKFTTYNGWLIDSETTTSSPFVADLLDAEYDYEYTKEEWLS